MKLFRKDRIFIAVIIAGLIVGGFVYLSVHKAIQENQVVGEKTSKCLASSQTMVTKVIDGDTVVVEGGYHIRLLGIDADERGYSCYEPAKTRLEKLILQKKVRLEKDKTDVDQYHRCLRYIFLGDENINLELVKEGLAVARFYSPDVKYKDEITKAEKKAIENKIGCKWSVSGGQNTAVITNEDVKRQWKWGKLTTAKLGYSTIDACAAGKYLGKKLIVEGKIADVYHDSKSNTVFLDFGKAYPKQCFVGVIFGSSLHRFVQNPEDYYLGKTARIFGIIKEYKGNPEIILETPSQIEVGE